MKLLLSLLWLLSVIHADLPPVRHRDLPEPEPLYQKEFAPKSAVAKEMMMVAFKENSSTPFDKAAVGCMLVFCQVSSEMQNFECREECRDFANRYNLDNDHAKKREKEGKLSVIEDKDQCATLCTALVSQTEESKVRCHSLCDIKFYYPDWREYQKELETLLNDVPMLSPLPIV